MLLFSTKQQNKWKTFKQSVLRKSESWLKIHKGRTKYMTNHADSEEILIDQQQIEKVTEFKYLGQNTHLKTLQKKKYMPGSEQRGAVLEKNKEILQDRQLPISLQNK